MPRANLLVSMNQQTFLKQVLSALKTAISISRLLAAKNGTSLLIVRVYSSFNTKQCYCINSNKGLKK
jgi:hypothetical protein